MKRVGFIIGTILAVLFGLILLFLAATWLLFRAATAPPPQPKFGYTGNWRGFNAVGFQERPLPSATNLWREYEAWKLGTNQHALRLYVARLGGAERQSGFRSSFSRGETPMGARDYTTVDFIYTDPTNGQYALTWTWHGKHDTSFLRFDENYRLYQLQPYGSSEDHPPKLSIRAIEGVRPENPTD